MKIHTSISRIEMFSTAYEIIKFLFSCNYVISEEVVNEIIIPLFSFVTFSVGLYLLFFLLLCILVVLHDKFTKEDNGYYEHCAEEEEDDEIEKYFDTIKFLEEKELTDDIVNLAIAYLDACKDCKYSLEERYMIAKKVYNYAHEQIKERVIHTGLEGADGIQKAVSAIRYKHFKIVVKYLENMYPSLELLRNYTYLIENEQ